MTHFIKDKLSNIFNRNKLEHALFYNWDWGLRFELNTSGSYIEMFTSAFDRSRELLAYTFTHTDVVYLLIRFRSYDDNCQKPKEMRRLKRCGFKLPEQYLLEKSSYIHDEGQEDEFTEYHHLEKSQILLNSKNYL